MKGRFRKGKKAYKKGNGCVPLWWTGSPRQQNLQARYYHMTLVREWEHLKAIKAMSVAVANASAAFQVAVASALPKPKDIDEAKWRIEKAAKIAGIAIDTSKMIALTLGELPPRPKLADYIKPAFTTGNQKGKFYSVDFGTKMNVAPIAISVTPRN